MRSRKKLAPEFATPDGSEPVPEYVLMECAYYRKAADVSQFGYLASESVALIAAASVPVVLIGNGPRFVGAVLGAIAAVASGVGSIFRCKDNYASRSITLEKIRASIARYHAAAHPDPAALVREVSRYVLEETAQWQQGFLSSPPKPDAAATGTAARPRSPA